MFGLVPFNFREINRSDDSLTSFINDFFELDKNYFNTIYSIKADIKDLGDKFIVEAEMPGINKEDIGLNIKDDTLVLSYKMKQKEEDKKDNFVRRERRYGEYKRSFYIQDIDREKVDAKYENGILKVELPKLEEKKNKNMNIEIK
ncbi:MAG: Hsp20/alpha crystallin family protein [Clostridiales bacterium]